MSSLENVGNTLGKLETNIAQLDTRSKPYIELTLRSK